MSNIDWNYAVSEGFFSEVGEIDKVANIFGRVAGKLVRPMLKGTKGSVRTGKNLSRNKYFKLTDPSKAGLSDKARIGAANTALWASRNPGKATAGLAGGGYLALS